MPEFIIRPHTSVEIIDQSFAGEIIPQQGMTAFVPFFSERGRDNKIVLFTSDRQFRNEIGELNYEKYGLGSYIASNVLKSGGNVYGIRLLPTGDASVDGGTVLNASVSNVLLGFKITVGTEDANPGKLVVEPITKSATTSETVENLLISETEADTFYLGYLKGIGRTPFFNKYGFKFN